MKVLITAGPTREYIDDVRYITNGSSGKMGAALAEEAMLRGYDATIVHGPVSIELPQCKLISAVSADEMTEKTLKELSKGYDVLISAAAIADFAPDKTCGKIRSGAEMTLALHPTRKLIDACRKEFPKLFIVAFKAECGGDEDALKETLSGFIAKKGVDIVVGNDISRDVFGSDNSELLALTKDGFSVSGKKTKADLARFVWDLIERT